MKAATVIPGSENTHALGLGVVRACEIGRTRYQFGHHRLQGLKHTLAGSAGRELRLLLDGLGLHRADRLGEALGEIARHHTLEFVAGLGLCGGELAAHAL